jgi:hypothetical protein
LQSCKHTTRGWASPSVHVASCRLKESFSEAIPSSIVDQLIPPNAVSAREAWRRRVRHPGSKLWSSRARIPQPQRASRQDCSSVVPIHQRIELNSRRTWFWRRTGHRASPRPYQSYKSSVVVGSMCNLSSCTPRVGCFARSSTVPGVSLTRIQTAPTPPQRAKGFSPTISAGCACQKLRPD